MGIRRTCAASQTIGIARPPASCGIRVLRQPSTMPKQLPVLLSTLSIDSFANIVINRLTISLHKYRLTISLHISSVLVNLTCLLSRSSCCLRLVVELFSQPSAYKRDRFFWGASGLRRLDVGNILFAAYPII